MAKSIMIQGTASGVGKTIITMALCRIFSQDGYRVAPFKSQNMTSNTVLTKDDDEIAMSQLLQAQAANVQATANMNPIVLKPSSKNKETSIILNGKAYATANAYNYKEIKKILIPEITKAYNCLSKQYDIVVIEGAGSPVELNMTKNSDDIVNMGIAKLTQSPVLLVADIDRGGVFASLYGTLNLLDKSEREYVKATIINRFKGDLSYFKEGVEIIEEITNIPVAGVVPHISFNMIEEDSLYNNNLTYLSKSDFEKQLNLIVSCIRKSLDINLIYQILNNGAKP